MLAIGHGGRRSRTRPQRDAIAGRAAVDRAVGTATASARGLLGRSADIRTRAPPAELLCALLALVELNSLSFASS